MAYLYPYGDTQQLNLDWLIEQWNEVKSQIDGSLQAEIDRVEAAITDLLTARNEAVAAQTAAQASAQAAAGSASTASGAASTATAQAQAASGSAATAGAHASDAQGYAATAQQAAQAANNSAGAAAVSEGNARNSETAAAGSSSAAAGNALYSEGYAKGTQNGNPVSSGSPYYENNAEYYAGQAAQDAQAAQNVLNSIPQDYSDLSNEVSELSTAITQFNSVVMAVPDLFTLSGEGSALNRTIKIKNNRIEVTISGNNGTYYNALLTKRVVYWSGSNLSAVTAADCFPLPNTANMRLLLKASSSAEPSSKDQIFVIYFDSNNDQIGTQTMTVAGCAFLSIPNGATQFAIAYRTRVANTDRTVLISIEPYPNV